MYLINVWKISLHFDIRGYISWPKKLPWIEVQSLPLSLVVFRNWRLFCDLLFLWTVLVKLWRRSCWNVSRGWKTGSETSCVSCWRTASSRMCFFHHLTPNSNNLYLVCRNLCYARGKDMLSFTPSIILIKHLNESCVTWCSIFFSILRNEFIKF